jgi:hypothetical protein
MRSSQPLVMHFLQRRAALEVVLARDEDALCRKTTNVILVYSLRVDVLGLALGDKVGDAKLRTHYAQRPAYKEHMPGD